MLKERYLSTELLWMEIFTFEFLIEQLDCVGLFLIS